MHVAVGKQLKIIKTIGKEPFKSEGSLFDLGGSHQILAESN